MPLMDGMEATRRIRTMDGGRAVKIVALSASVFKDEREELLAAGADDFVAKPIQFEHIFECLAHQLGVRFVAEERTAAAVAGPGGLPGLEAIAGLPTLLRGELAEALVTLDVAQIADILRRISEINPELGVVLARLADELEYTVLLQAVQADEGDQDRKAP